MANLRTNNLSGEGGRNAYNGSVFFDGAENTYLTLASGAIISGTGFGTGDFTVEFWINQGVNDSNYTNLVSLYASTNVKRFQIAFLSSTIQVYTHSGSWADTGYAPTAGVYEHIAFQRDYSGSTLKMYANGEEKWSASNNRDYDEAFETYIGDGPTASYSAFQGYLSNVRICMGHLVYSSNYFTPPTSELKVHYISENDKTILLCCQDSDDPTQEATGKTITAYGGVDFSHNPDNLVKNGRFTSSVTAEWTLTGGTAALSTGQSGTFGDGNHVLLTATSSYAYLKQSFTTVVGRTYRVNAQSNGGDASFISTSTSENDAVVTDIRSSTQTTDGRSSSKSFVATQTTYHVILRGNTGGANFDSVSVYEEENRVPPKVLPPFGTDAGNTFGGGISMNSLDYMYFPTGRTEERGRGRALFMGGSQNPFTPNIMDTIDYVDINSEGVAVRFGSLTTTNSQSAAFASSTRGINAGGQTSAPGDNQTNIIEFVTIATEGNGTDFGDLDTTHRRFSGSGHSSQTRGIITGGSGDSPGVTNVIQYVTIASFGDAQNFGDLLNPKDNMMSKNGSSTRMLICGGRDYTPSATATNVIEYITIATLGDSQNFGDLTQARFAGTGCGSATRGVIAGGQTPTYVSTIDYVTIASTGDALDFGELEATTSFLGGASNSIKGIFAGGATPTKQSYISSIEIATTGNATSYGDNTITNPVTSRGTCSDSHGGLS